MTPPQIKIKTSELKGKVHKQTKRVEAPLGKGVFKVEKGPKGEKGESGNFTIDRMTLDSSQVLLKKLTLSEAPLDGQKVIFEIQGAPKQFYGEDYIVSGNELSWDGLGLDGLLETGDNVEVQYFS